MTVNGHVNVAWLVQLMSDNASIHPTNDQIRYLFVLLLWATGSWACWDTGGDTDSWAWWWWWWWWWWGWSSQWSWWAIWSSWSCGSWGSSWSWWSCWSWGSGWSSWSSWGSWGSWWCWWWRWSGWNTAHRQTGGSTGARAWSCARSWRSLVLFTWDSSHTYANNGQEYNKLGVHDYVCVGSGLTLNSV